MQGKLKRRENQTFKLVQNSVWNREIWSLPWPVYSEGVIPPLWNSSSATSTICYCVSSPLSYPLSNILSSRHYRRHWGFKWTLCDPYFWEGWKRQMSKQMTTIFWNRSFNRGNGGIQRKEYILFFLFCVLFLNQAMKLMAVLCFLLLCVLSTQCYFCI